MTAGRGGCEEGRREIKNKKNTPPAILKKH
jgi:hypothetical protein